MEIDRRRFMALVAACGAAAVCPSARAGTPPAPGQGVAGMRHGGLQDSGAVATQASESVGDVLYLAARKQASRYEAALFDERGHAHLVVPMPARGHSFAIDAPRSRAVVFGRQPGFFAIAFHFEDQTQPQPLPMTPERHFFGHGVFSPDGKLLIATENDYEGGRGVLGVYDASEGGGYRRIGEFPTGGIGPHEVILMPDGHTLCVANGGILTHPDYGKLALNAHDMDPSVAYIDIRTGDLIEQVSLAPALHKLSIRHMVLDGAGAVWFGCQHTGPAQERPPLVGRHRRGEALAMYSGPDSVLHGMKNYVGSLACDATGTRIATSSPVGGCVVVWDAASGDCLGSTPVFDGCGVAPRQSSGFLVSSGQGQLAGLRTGEPLQPLLAPEAGLAWDNHMRKI
ncbi:DUF1513 domain-containing protein [Allopusillimonas ginsengisoli]|uniref:DUF1513 domain-containing protein n=1 Tax=Allopusillimonas ginsengisoli TaxID=453575 RepID=UPI003CC8A3C8